VGNRFGYFDNCIDAEDWNNMTSKTNMYKRIKDLEQTNKLLSDIIMELVKKMPKGKLSDNMVKYSGARKCRK
jgi:hypothetical protein